MKYTSGRRYGTNSRSQNSTGVRTATGSVMAEGAIAMCMVIGSSVLATLLIMNSFCMIFYKTKLTHVGYLAAAYASAHDGDNGVESETTDYIKTTMTSMSLAPNNLQVTVKTIQLAENPAVQVTIANDFPIAGISTGGASNIKIEDTEIASH